MNPNSKPAFITQTIWQTPLILLIAAIFALAVNFLRPGGIALVENWDEKILAENAAGETPVISLDRAEKLYKSNNAVFIDARPASAFQEGHIKGALSLPWSRAEEKFIDVASRIEPGKTIITYCDGIACDLSHNLAEFLSHGLGFDNVYVLIDGWSRWRENGLPTAETTG